MLGVTYFFLGRIYFGHIVLRRQRRRNQQPEEPNENDGNGDVNNGNGRPQGENQGKIIVLNSIRNVQLISEIQTLKSKIV